MPGNATTQGNTKRKGCSPGGMQYQCSMTTCLGPADGLTSLELPLGLAPGDAAGDSPLSLSLSSSLSSCSLAAFLLTTGSSSSSSSSSLGSGDDGGDGVASFFAPLFLAGAALGFGGALALGAGALGGGLAGAALFLGDLGAAGGAGLALVTLAAGALAVTILAGGAFFDFLEGGGSLPSAGTDTLTAGALRLGAIATAPSTPRCVFD